MVWWNISYPFRRQLKVTGSPTGTPANHPAVVVLDTTLTVDKGKMNSDFSDLEVVFESGGTSTQLSRTTSAGTNQVTVGFPLQQALLPGEVSTGSYYIYYGNPSMAATPPMRPPYVATLWPVSVGQDDFSISYTRPDEYWHDGVSDVEGARATFVFAGSKVRLLSDIGPDKAVIEVQLDSGVWEEVDLFAYSSASSAPVYTKEGLSEANHEVRVKVTGRKNPSSRGDSVNIVRFEYAKHVDVVDLGEQIDDLIWSSTLGGT